MRNETSQTIQGVLVAIGLAAFLILTNIACYLTA